MEFIRNEFEEIAGNVPPDIAELTHVPPHIPVYSLSRNIHPRNLKRSHVKGTVRHVPEFPTITRKSDGRAFATFHRKQTIEALGLLCDPGMLSDSRKREAYRCLVGHELTHIITDMGISRYMRSINEALTDALVQQRYGNATISGESLTDITLFKWDGTSIQSTTGFAPPDCADIRWNAMSASALYLASPHALRGIATEKVWQIWKILLEEGEKTGCYPLRNDIRNAILTVLQDDGHAVLRNPCFQDLREGANVFSINSEDKSCALAVSFDVIPDPTFGIDAQGVYQPICCSARPSEKRIPFLSRVYGKDEKRIPDITISATMGNIQGWSFSTFLDQTRASPNFPTLEKKLGSRIDVEVPGLRPIEIRQSANDPHVRRVPVWEEMWTQSSPGKTKK